MLLNQTLGEYIKDIRTQNALKCSDLAKMLGISTAYLCQIENGARSHPSEDLILQIAVALDLTSVESTTLFDLYAETSGQLPPDITEYLSDNKTAQHALRKARDAKATDADWKRFIEQLKK